MSAKTARILSNAFSPTATGVSFKLHGYVDEVNIPDFYIDNLVVYQILGNTELAVYVENFEDAATFTIANNGSYGGNVAYFASVETAIEKINAIGEVGLTSGAVISAARRAYDALNEIQKAAFSTDTLKVLTDAEAAFAAIGTEGEYIVVSGRNIYSDGLTIGLPGLTLASNATYKFEMRVVAPELAADKLAEVRLQVYGSDRLTGGVWGRSATLKDGPNWILSGSFAGNGTTGVTLKIHGEGNDAVVPDLYIDSIVVYQTVNGVESVYYVQDFENANTFTYAKLDTATVIWTGVVNSVIKLINAIPADVTINDAAAISAAREAYNALTDTDKELVTNYSVLVAAEAAIKPSGNYYWADVTGYPGGMQINLPGVSLTKGNKYEIELDLFSEVEAGYRVMLFGISSYHNATDYSKGKTASADWNTFTGLAAYTADNDYASGLYKATIDAARAAYDALSPMYAEDVAEAADKLVAAEKTYNDLVIANAATEFIEAVAAIPAVDELTVADAGTVAAARVAYDALDEAVKAEVADELAVLESAEAKMTALIEKNNAAVDSVINGMPESVNGNYVSVTASILNVAGLAIILPDYFEDGYKYYAYFDYFVVGAEGATEADMRVMFKDGSGKLKINGSTPHHDLVSSMKLTANAWTGFEGSFTAKFDNPELTDKNVRLEIHGAGTDNAPDFYIDNVVIVKESPEGVKTVLLNETFDEIVDLPTIYTYRDYHDETPDEEGGLIPCSTVTLVGEAVDTAKAARVDALIEAIGTVEYTDECLAKIVAAENALKALTAEQKLLVTKEEALTDARETYDVLAKMLKRSQR